MENLFDKLIARVSGGTTDARAAGKALNEDAKDLAFMQKESSDKLQAGADRAVGAAPSEVNGIEALKVHKED